MEYQDMQTEGMERMQPPNNMAIASLVLGILALVTFCCHYTVFPLGGLSILFGILSRPEGRFRGAAKAGMILAGIAIGMTLIFYQIALLPWIGNSIMDPAIQNMPVIPEIPEVPELPKILEHTLTVLSRLPMGGVR